MNAPDPAAIDRWVNRWVGTPYLYDGRTTDGIDCYGLVVRFYADLFDVNLPDWQIGAQTLAWRTATLADERRRWWAPIGVPRDPCCAMMSRRDPARPHHIGIYWRAMIVHADHGTGVKAEPVGAFSRLYGEPEYLDLRAPADA